MHERIVTPETDPDRFTEQEAEAFYSGVCGETGYGHWGDEICGRTSLPGASFGNCDEHWFEMLVDHWPDGTPRPGSGFDAERGDREEAALAAHQRNCDDSSCECKG